jgi:hypothetical protein
VRATMARLTAFAASLGGPLTVVGEIAGTVPAAHMPGTCRLLTILREVSGISGTPFFRHLNSSVPSSQNPDRLTRRTGNDEMRSGFSYKHDVIPNANFRSIVRFG